MSRTPGVHVRDVPSFPSFPSPKKGRCVGFARPGWQKCGAPFVNTMEIQIHISDFVNDFETTNCRFLTERHAFCNSRSSRKAPGHHPLGLGLKRGKHFFTKSTLRETRELLHLHFANRDALGHLVAVIERERVENGWSFW